MKYFTVLPIVILAALTSHSVELQMDKSAFTDEFYETMKILSSRSELADTGKKFICVKTTRFEISNLYILPFMYSKMTAGTKKAGDYSAQEIADMFEYFAVDISTKNLFFYESLDKNIGAENIEMEEHIRNYGIDFQSKVFGREFLYNDVIKTVVVRKYLRQFIFDRIIVTDREIEEYYEANPSAGLVKKRAIVRMIRMSFRGLPEKKKAEKRLVMEDISARLVKGDDFSALAKKYSDDPATVNSGGLVGDYLEQGEAEDYIDGIIFKLKPGETSPVKEYREAFYIFKTERFDDERHLGISDMKDVIRRTIIQKKEQRLLDAERKRLEKKYRLEIILTDNQ